MGFTRGPGNFHSTLRRFAEWPLQILAACAPCKAAQLLHCCSLSHAEYVLVKVICLILPSAALQPAGHTAQLQFCMHTIASVQAKQFCMQTISAAKHPARLVGTTVTTCDCSCWMGGNTYSMFRTSSWSRSHCTTKLGYQHLARCQALPDFCWPNIRNTFLSHTWCCMRQLYWANCKLTLQPHTVYLYSTADVCIRLITSSVVLPGTSWRARWSGATTARLQAFHESVSVHPRAGHF